MSPFLSRHHHPPPTKPTKSPQGKPENLKLAQEALLKRAKANSDAQLGQYNPANESAEAGERTYEKGYKVRECVGGGALRSPMIFQMGHILCSDRPASRWNTCFCKQLSY